MNLAGSRIAAAANRLGRASISGYERRRAQGRALRQESSMTKHRNSPEVVSNPRRGFAHRDDGGAGHLAVVLGIVILAVNAARTSARKAATQQTMSSLSQATNQFILDERRTPGYFSMRELASSENANRGFTAMDNLFSIWPARSRRSCR